MTICHWTGGGTWQPLEVAHESLGGHDNHDLDIWPPVDGVTPGHNWPRGEAIYLNGCLLSAIEEPGPSPSPSDLPSTGAGWVLGMFLVALLLIAAGLALSRYSGYSKALPSSRTPG